MADRGNGLGIADIRIAAASDEQLLLKIMAADVAHMQMAARAQALGDDRPDDDVKQPHTQPVLYYWRGERRTACGWAKHLGMSAETVRNRLQAGLDLDEVFTPPVKGKRNAGYFQQRPDVPKSRRFRVSLAAFPGVS